MPLRCGGFSGQWLGGVVLCLLVFSGPALSAVSSDEAVWRALLKQSMQHHKKRQYDQAADMARQAIDFARQSFGDTDPKLAASLRRLAYVYSYQKRYEESVPLLQKALLIIERHYGGEHQQVASYLSYLANHQSHLGERREAERLYERALRMREKVLGPEHLDLSYNLNALARIAERDKDLDRAESLYRRGLAIRQKNLPANHGLIAESWSFLARLHKKQQRYADAILAQRQAVAIKRAKHGPGHKSVVGYERSLARLEKRAAGQGIIVSETIAAPRDPTPAPSIAATGSPGKRGRRQPQVAGAAKKQRPESEAGRRAPANELQVILDQARHLMTPLLKRNYVAYLVAIIFIVLILRRISIFFRLTRSRAGLGARDLPVVNSAHSAVQDMNPRRRRPSFG